MVGNDIKIMKHELRKLQNWTLLSNFYFKLTKHQCCCMSDYLPIFKNWNKNVCIVRAQPLSLGMCKQIKWERKGISKCSIYFSLLQLFGENDSEHIYVLRGAQGKTVKCMMWVYKAYLWIPRKDNYKWRSWVRPQGSAIADWHHSARIAMSKRCSWCFHVPTQVNSKTNEYRRFFFNVLKLWITLVSIIMSEWQGRMPIRSSGNSPVLLLEAWLLRVKPVHCKRMGQTYLSAYFLSEIFLSTAVLLVRIFVGCWDCCKVRQKPLKSGFILK